MCKIWWFYHLYSLFLLSSNCSHELDCMEQRAFPCRANKLDEKLMEIQFEFGKWVDVIKGHFFSVSYICHDCLSILEWSLCLCTIIVFIKCTVCSLHLSMMFSSKTIQILFEMIGCFVVLYLGIKSDETERPIHFSFSLYISYIIYIEYHAFWIKQKLNDITNHA